MNNKKLQSTASRFRLKTLESPYICGKDHRYPISANRSKIDEQIRRKLNVKAKNARMQTLQANIMTSQGFSMNRSAKLSPIKEGKYILKKEKSPIEKEEPDIEEKMIKLKLFLNNRDLLIEHWQKKQEAEKEKFLAKLKEAEDPYRRSLKKLTKEKKLKQSLKNIHDREEKIKPKERRSASKLRYNNPIKTIQQLETDMEKYYIQNLLSLMQENKKSLMEDRKKLKKKLQKEEKEQVQQSKREIARQIEEDLLREQHIRKQEKLQQYRKDLQAELQRQLYSEREVRRNEAHAQDTTLNTKYNELFKLLNTQKVEEEHPEPQNPEKVKKNTSQSKREAKSKSMLELNNLEAAPAVDPLVAFSQRQQQVNKVVERYEPSLTNPNSNDKHDEGLPQPSLQP